MQLGLGATPGAAGAKQRRDGGAEDGSGAAQAAAGDGRGGRHAPHGAVGAGAGTRAEGDELRQPCWLVVMRFARRLGGGEARPHWPPSKIVLTRGLRGLLDYLTLEAILAEEEREYGGLPPRIAAAFGRTPPLELGPDVRPSTGGTPS